MRRATQTEMFPEEVSRRAGRGGESGVEPPHSKKGLRKAEKLGPRLVNRLVKKETKMAAITEEKLREMITGILAANGGGAPAAPANGFTAAPASAGGGFGAQPVQAAPAQLPAPEAVLVPMKYAYQDGSTLTVFLMFPGSIAPNLDALAALCEGVRAIPGVNIWKPSNGKSNGFRRG